MYKIASYIQMAWLFQLKFESNIFNWSNDSSNETEKINFEK